MYSIAMFSAIVTLLALLLALVIKQHMIFVPEGTIAVIERQAKFSRLSESGATFLLPFIEKLRGIVPMYEIMFESPQQQVFTQDGASVNVRMLVYYQISGDSIEAKREAVLKAIYNVSDWKSAFEKRAIAILHTILGKLQLKDFLGISSIDEETPSALRMHTASLVEQALAKEVAKWGITVNKVYLTDIQVDESTMKELKAESEAKRDAEIERIKHITEAEKLARMERLKTRIREEAINQFIKAAQAGIIPSIDPRIAERIIEGIERIVVENREEELEALEPEQSIVEQSGLMLFEKRMDIAEKAAKDAIETLRLRLELQEKNNMSITEALRSEMQLQIKALDRRVDDAITKFNTTMTLFTIIMAIIAIVVPLLAQLFLKP